MLEKVTDRIYYLMNEEENERPALGIVKGDQCCLLIDAGNSIEHAKILQKELEKMNFPPVRYVVLTHHHWDHAKGISAWDAMKIASSSTAELIKINYSSEQWSYINFDILFQGEFVINLGGCTCCIKELINPHRKDGTIIYVPDERTLFLGDAAYGKAVNGHNYLDRHEVIKMMEEVDTYEAEYYLCSHESICTKDEMMSYWNQINMGFQVTLGCKDKDEAIVRFQKKYGRVPNKEDLFFIESFFE